MEKRMSQNREGKEGLSIYISYLLRHKPEDIGLTMYDLGWVNTTDLINGINAANNIYEINMLLLEEIVEEDEKYGKGRYSFNEDKSQIKANQGHSVKGIVFNFKEATPPEVLFHGTAMRFMPLIKKSGCISKMNRYAVHLSSDANTAISVGQRHVNSKLSSKDNVVILEVDTMRMMRDGYKFSISDNGVWLIDKVPLEYLTIYDTLNL